MFGHGFAGGDAVEFGPEAFGALTAIEVSAGSFVQVSLAFDFGILQ